MAVWQIRGADMVMFLPLGGVVTLRRNLDRDRYDTRRSRDDAREGDWTSWWFDGDEIHPPLGKHWSLRAAMLSTEAWLSRRGLL